MYLGRDPEWSFHNSAGAGRFEDQLESAGLLWNHRAASAGRRLKREDAKDAKFAKASTIGV
jgi:hypothetical protein